jgi:hypothetical protein
MDKKISQLTGATTPLTGTEELAIVQGGSTVKATAQDVADLAGGALPVSNTYPVTTPASAGTRFWYKGNEWHYMTSDEIASAGWTGLVSVGFPAPVSKNYNANIFTDFTGLTSSFTNGVSPIYSPAISAYTTVDCLGIGNPTRVRFFSISASGQAASIRNAQLLINVEDQGTAQGIYIGFNQFSSTALNNFFTDLPATIKTVTIYAANNPGSATCTPAIATAKGYTVVV